PVQTAVTYFAVADWRRTKSIVSRSAIAPITPFTPPGIQIRSSGGVLAKLCVGTRLNPQSLGTGGSDLAVTKTLGCGKRAGTCKGPVRSSCVRSGKMTNPTLKSDMAIRHGYPTWQSDMAFSVGRVARKADSTLAAEELLHLMAGLGEIHLS